MCQGLGDVRYEGELAMAPSALYLRKVLGNRFPALPGIQDPRHPESLPGSPPN